MNYQDFKIQIAKDAIRIVSIYEPNLVAYYTLVDGKWAKLRMDPWTPTEKAKVTKITKRRYADLTLEDAVLVLPNRSGALAQHISHFLKSED